MSLNDWVQYVIEGFPVGCIYGLVAIGLVLTYKTSGVFNLAFGAQAFMSAAIMYELKQGGMLGLPAMDAWLAFVIAVFIVSPLFGLLLDRALFRYMRNSSWVVKLVSSLGLFVALPEIVKALISGVQPQFNAPSVANLIGMTDLAGNLVTQASWSFTTAAPPAGATLNPVEDAYVDQRKATPGAK